MNRTGKSLHRASAVLAAAAIVLCALALAPAPAKAQPPLISYQGRLADGSGAPVTGVNVDMTFTFYSAPSGGVAYLTVIQKDIPVDGGIYSVLIGSGSVIPGAERDLPSVFENHGEVYLGVRVGNDAEMTPRQRIASAPFALNASASFIDRFINTADFDGDGYDKLSAGGNDCDDGSASAYPGAAEVPCDGVDQDCDGQDRCSILITAADYSGNNPLYSGLLEPRGVTPPLNAIGLGSDPSLDPVLPALENLNGGDPYVINRQGYSAVGLGSVSHLDPSNGFTADLTFPVNNGTNAANPQDMARLAPNKAYVTRFEPPYNDIVIVDPQTGTTAGTIDLSSLGTNPDGLPRPTAMLQVGATVYTLIQNINSSFSVYGNGRIAAINSVTDSLAGVIDLATLNPSALAYLPSSNKLLVASTGDWADTSLSGLELVDIATLSSDTVLVRGNDPDIGGFISGMVVPSEGEAVLNVSLPSFGGNNIQSYNLDSGEVSPPHFFSWYISDIARDGFGRVLAADNAGSQIVIIETGAYTTVDIESLSVGPQSVIHWH